jgi:hypothetical protein
MVNKNGAISITFHHEPSDRSVGIMAEGFSAWNNTGKEWCEIADIGKTFETTKFQWFTMNGDAIDRPKNAIWIEKALYTFAETFYSLNEYEGPEVEV